MIYFGRGSSLKHAFVLLLNAVNFTGAQIWILAKCLTATAETGNQNKNQAGEQTTASYTNDVHVRLQVR
ncbi:MAG: hypothetical protein CMN77_02170 [Spirochaetaceae bacterium]|mgnify:FL=1|nr:hypothetical protein [Spirochaetaceae bacterium]